MPVLVVKRLKDTCRALLVTEGQRMTVLCDEWAVKLEQNKDKINEDIQVTQEKNPAVLY